MRAALAFFTPSAGLLWLLGLAGQCQGSRLPRNPLVDFLAMDRDVAWSLKTQLHPVAVNAEDDHTDVSGDDCVLSGFSAQYQHLKTSLHFFRYSFPQSRTAARLWAGHKGERVCP
jgi:hypothetical protein